MRLRFYAHKIVEGNLLAIAVHLDLLLNPDK